MAFIARALRWFGIRGAIGHGGAGTAKMKVEPSLSSQSYVPHLAMQSCVLRPGAEWQPPYIGWSLVQVQAGVGYWLDQEVSSELKAGSVLALARKAAGSVRASQTGEMRLKFFRVEPELLTGLVTLAEQSRLERAASNRESSSQILPPEHLVAMRFKELAAVVEQSGFRGRAQLLELFTRIRVFAEEIEQSQSANKVAREARDRLEEYLTETLPADFLTVSFVELAQRMKCTPRHLSRIFHEVAGMSFREKQARIRLARASELLATTDAKVVDVALDSGYQSLSLFSLMFKKRFGLSPGKWRQKHRREKRPRPSRKLPAGSLAAVN